MSARVIDPSRRVPYGSTTFLRSLASASAFGRGRGELLVDGVDGFGAISVRCASLEDVAQNRSGLLTRLRQIEGRKAGNDELARLAVQPVADGPALVPGRLAQEAKAAKVVVRYLLAPVERLDVLDGLGRRPSGG
jgi:hypothetical protein